MPDTPVTPLARLREPFPPNVVGQLPKPYKADSPKGNCSDCDGYHGLPAVHLDFVGHAAVTDRLLSVDPAWTWEPLALDPTGLPALDRSGNLWIRLTVCGVTRLGVGDGKSMKEVIGDAIRNAAMRFGVALDLWTKDELESTPELGSNEKPTTRARAPKSQPEPESAKSQPAPDKGEKDSETEKARRAMWAIAHEKFPDETVFRTWIAKGLHLEEGVSLSTLTRAQMVETTGHLRNLDTPDGPNIPEADR